MTTLPSPIPRALLFLFLALPFTALPAQQPGPALAVADRLPAQGATAACPDTQLHLTFNSPPTIGTTGQVRIYDAADNRLVDTLDLSVPVAQQSYTIGGVQFAAYPVLVNGNTAIIFPHPQVLTTGRTYYVHMDPGVLRNDAGDFAGFSGPAGWKFTTKATLPAADAGRLVVSADGAGDFATVQGALDFIPDGNTRPVTVFIRRGVYTELIAFANKANITLLGEDRQGTVIGYPNSARLNRNRSVLQANNVRGTAIVNLTLRNTTAKGSGGTQAETIIFRGANSTLLIAQSSFYSYQDTIQINCPGYITDSYAEGDIDFLWGTGSVFYNHCSFLELTSRDSVVVLRNTTNHGAVFLNCKFDTAPGVTGAFLAQNQGYANSEVVLLNCALGPGFNPVGWRGTNTDQVHNWELNSTNISDGKPVDVSQRAPWSRQLSAEKDAELIANYSNPTFVLGGWTPQLAPIILKQPGEAWSVGVGQGLPLTVQVAAVPAPAYQWMRDGQPLADGAAVSGATTATLRLSSAASGVYTVVVTNAAGTVTSAPLAITAQRTP